MNLIYLISRGTSVFTNPIKKIIKRSVDAKVVKDVEEEMMNRFEKMSMRSLLKLTDTMTEKDFEEDNDEELEQKLEVRAKRSLSAVAGAIGLSAIYKKFLSTQDECRQVDVPHCAEVPIETCYDVRNCEVQRKANLVFTIWLKSTLILMKTYCVPD